jgi:dolichyl-diphosphooligosaccharide--protein glycosyltransferase
MIWKIYSVTKIGSWDFNERTTKPTDYVELHCFAMVDEVMRCSDGTIDLNRGFMNDGSTDIPLRGALFVDDGYVVDRKDYDHDSGYYLQVLMKNGKAFLTLVADGPLFRSNFNQQYLLGNFDQRYFEEVYNDYPVARVLKVKKTRPDNGPDRPAGAK